MEILQHIDLAIIWSGILALAIIMYVLLDGFDLGIGILSKYAKDEKDQARMINSIAPFWDGNETWLILGGGCLLIGFPVAYAIIMQALYLPIIFMLLGLILRGVAFEFIFKSTDKQRKIWINFFHYGSLIASFFQGVILGEFILGFTVENKRFVGSSMDWFNPFCLIVGAAIVAGYTLLGSGWLVMKTTGKIHDWGRKMSTYSTFVVLFFMLVVSVYLPFVNAEIFDRWFSLPNFYYLAPVPIITFFVAMLLVYNNFKPTKDHYPFILSILMFLLGYVGLAISIFPWIVPHSLTIWDCLAARESIEISIIGVVGILPVILIYTAYNYYVFRGKVSHESMYK